MLHLLLVFFYIYSNKIFVVFGANILCVFQMPAVSHQATFMPIAKALSLRGHNVIAVTPHPLKDENLINLTEIDTSISSYEVMQKHGFEFFMSKELTVQSKIRKIFALYNELAEVIFGNVEFKKIYMNNKNNNQHINNNKFDLIISQIYISPIMFALSAKLNNTPIIGVSSMGGWSGTHLAMGNPNPPAIYSEMFLHYNGDDLTYYERIKSTLYFIWTRFYIYFIAMPKCDAIARKYLGTNLPYLADIERNVSAIFLNINPILYTPRPMVPTMIPLSFMHIKPINKELPEDIKQEIEDAKNGVIYFSLGSNVKSVNIPIRIRNLLMQSFKLLPYKILWKFEGEELPGKPENVILRKWLPQQDVLAHPNVKVFITQCGLQSIEEAIDKEIPMIGIPFIADQEMNSIRLARAGVLKHIDYLNTTKEELINSIIEVAQNPMYRENMKKLKNLLQDEVMSGIEKAVWWSEYVIRHGGTQHLKSPTVNIEWYKYLLLDVFAIIVLIILIFIKVFSTLIKRIISRKIKKD